MIQSRPYLSVVIPVYNEAKNLPTLWKRLSTTLDQLNRPYEVIMVNDGSRDDSAAVLEALCHNCPNLKVIDFTRNFGQHMAVMAGFENASGEWVATLDADLQNPPEEIPRLLHLAEQGHDLVSGVRLYERQDSWFRRNVSILINKVRAIITDLEMTDHGCMLKVYHRTVVELMVATRESSLFIPALAYRYAANPTEIKVQHEARSAGDSKYSLYSLIRLNFDLMTGYSLVPLQIFTVIGLGIAFLSMGFGIFLLIRRLLIGPEVQGVFTLFTILFFLVGVLLMGLGIMGEYIGRIYNEVRDRPRFAIRRILGAKVDEKNLDSRG